MPRKPTKCFIDLGPGDGEKTIIPVQYALESGRYQLVSAVLVDCSDDMLNVAEKTLQRLSGYMPDKFRIKRFQTLFENLKNDEAFKKFIREHDIREWLFYGTTAGNFDPPILHGILVDNMLSGDRAQVGLHLYTEGRDDAIIKSYEGLAMRDVSFVGLKELAFADKDKEEMDYYVELTKREYEEFKEFDLGLLMAIKTFFRARKPMERGLVTLKAGDSLQAVLSIKYKEDQAIKVFEHKGKLVVLNKNGPLELLPEYKDDDISIIYMMKTGG